MEIVMTFNEIMKKFLVDNGMFDEQVSAVMDSATTHEMFSELKGRTHEDESSYPPIMRHICVISIKVVALEYIDEHCPKAWFRPCFLSLAEQKKAIPEAYA